MKQPSVLSLLGLASLTIAAQPSAPEPIAAPLRDLKFGTLNFLHSTDTHGWHAGHLLEPSYSADWGDYVDFASRLREQIEADGNDLLVVDTGDRIEGNGLYDSSDPKGKYTFDIFKHQHMDIMCIGNHELYKQNSSENEYNILVPAYHHAYIASNLNIKEPTTGEIVPLARRFRKFTTKNQGIRILAFGFVFDFTLNYNNTVVQPVEETVQEEWFQEAIRDRTVDLIVVAAHATARSDELNNIYKAIRSVQWDVPIQFFAGHLHVRDYKQFDSNAFALASGRFMETIGFQSIDGIQGGGNTSPDTPSIRSTPTWFRRYIDNNLYSYYNHSNTNASTFHSVEGRAISKQIAAARKELNLDEKLGCAEHNLWMSRAPFPSNHSLYSWLNESVFPEAIIESDRANKSRFVMVNSGAMRFDIFAGPFTKDSMFIISPFVNGMHYIQNVSLAKATQMAALLNAGDTIYPQSEGQPIKDLWRLAPPEQQGRISKEKAMRSSLHQHSGNDNNQILLSPHTSDVNVDADNLIPGYTTSDDAGTDGDDTIHSTIQFHTVPNVITSYIPTTPASASAFSEEDEDETVDLIFNAFIQPFVLGALQLLGVEYSSDKDVRTYLYGETMTDMMARWVRENWNGDC